MRMILCIFALSAVSCTGDGERGAKRRLQYYIASRAEGGSVFYQASLEGVDYRTLLRGAMAKDSASLARIFQFTAQPGVMGEGAESNCEILLLLLRQWGDKAYARVLAGQSPDVRAAVISALDYTWGYPGWQANEFPTTYRLADHVQRQ